MTKEFVSYEIAKELKELGFNEECMAVYNYKYRDDSFEKIDNVFNSELIHFGLKEKCTAPLWQQVIDWFTDKNIHINIQSSYVLENDKKVIKYSFWFLNNNIRDNNDLEFSTHSEAREKAILKAIEIVVGI